MKKPGIKIGKDSRIYLDHDSGCDRDGFIFGDQLEGWEVVKKCEDCGKFYSQEGEEEFKN